MADDELAAEWESLPLSYTFQQGHPLLRLENAVCTPHIGYVEQDSYELYFDAAFDNVLNFIRSEPTNIVNPDALKVIR